MTKQIKRHLWWAPSAVLLLVALVQWGFLAKSAQNIISRATWQYKAKSLKEAKNDSKVVIKGEVIDVQRGADIPNVTVQGVGIARGRSEGADLPCRAA